MIYYWWREIKCARSGYRDQRIDTRVPSSGWFYLASWWTHRTSFQVASVSNLEETETGTIKSRDGHSPLFILFVCEQPISFVFVSIVKNELISIVFKIIVYFVRFLTEQSLSRIVRSLKSFVRQKFVFNEIFRSEKFVWKNCSLSKKIVIIEFLEKFVSSVKKVKLIQTIFNLPWFFPLVLSYIVYLDLCT